MQPVPVPQYHTRAWLFAALVVTAAAGIGSKVYDGPGQAWAREHGGGVLYEMFWILAVALVWPRRHGLPWVSIAVLTVTCGLEAAQLWHPPWLERIRATFLGHALLGSTFSWGDFPHYVLGCGLGWLLGWWICPKVAGSG